MSVSKDIVHVLSVIYLCGLMSHSLSHVMSVIHTQSVRYYNIQWCLWISRE